MVTNSVTFSASGNSKQQGGTASASPPLQDNAPASTTKLLGTEVPLKTTINGIPSLNEVLQRFEQERKHNPSKKVAVISGGSLSGMAAALKLKNLGFNVIIAEKRKSYSRPNVLALREEALYSLANLSPNGKLIKSLVDGKKISICKQNIAKDGTSYRAEKYHPCRFMDWMLPKEKIGFLAIPDRGKKHPKQADYLDLANLGNKRKKEPFKELDLAWPDNEVSIPVKPEYWRYKDLTKIGTDNLAIAQVKELEAGLNQYCIDQGIEFVGAETEIEQNNNKKYSATFSMKNGEKVAHTKTNFPIDLICLAENPNGKNISKISEQSTIPTNESVYFTNCSGRSSDLGGMTARVFDAEDTTVVLQASKKDEDILNVGTRGKVGEQITPATLQKQLEKVKPVLAAAKSNIDSSYGKKISTSPRLDIDLKCAMNPIESNVIIIGDAAAAGSPIGGLGGSLALSAYPEAIERLVTHPDFNSADKKKRSALENNFRHDIAQIANIRHGEMSNVMRQMGFYSEKTNKAQLLQGASSLFLLNDGKRKGLITKPCHPAGEAWLRREFEKMSANVPDEASKPPRHVLEQVISGKLAPIKSRSPLEVYWEHILLRYIGDVKTDIQRNYSKDLKLSLLGCKNRLLMGHDGIKESAKILNTLLPNTTYNIDDTVVRCKGNDGWVTERWGYFDPHTKTQVRDGIDTFQISNGQIQTKMIHYTVSNS
jgi:hypothetical protein